MGRHSRPIMGFIALCLCRLESATHPAHFQHTIDVILSSIKWQFALNYLNDLVVFSKTLQRYITQVRKVLLLLHSAGATITVKKCYFFTDTIDCLGHVSLQSAWSSLFTRQMPSVDFNHPPTIQNYTHSLDGATSSFDSSLALLESQVCIINA